MWRSLVIDRPSPELLALQAERAGLALACAYSSSSEYEAALIHARRAAGVYGPKRHRRRAILAGAALALLAILLVIV